MFGNNEFEKRTFHHYNNLIFLQHVDINNILLSSMTTSSKSNYKYIIGFKDNYYKIKPLRIMLPKTNP